MFRIGPKTGSVSSWRIWDIRIEPVGSTHDIKTRPNMAKKSALKSSCIKVTVKPILVPLWIVNKKHSKNQFYFDHTEEKMHTMNHLAIDTV